MHGDSGNSEPELRIGDADRDQVIAVLREHTAAGRLTLGEFSDRAGAVVAARTRSELEPLVADLPALSPPSDTPDRGAARWTLALLGDIRQRGRWRVPRRTKAVAVLGDVVLDLTGATFEGTEISIKAVALMGDIVVVVPAGMEVELSGTPILGDTKLRVAEGDSLPGLPRLRIRAVAVLGDVTVKT